MNTFGRASVLLAYALLFVAVAHSLEDFAYGVPEERLGIDTGPAAVLAAMAFTAQIAVLAYASRRERWAYLANIAIGLVWLLAAALDHLGEVLTAEDYRAGLLSKGLEVVVMAFGLALALTSWLAVRTRAER